MIKDRAQITATLFNHRDRLTVDDKFYKQWVFRYTFLELEKDLDGHGDITTDSLTRRGKKVKARIYANEPGIMAGGDEVNYFVSTSDPVFRPRLNEIPVTQRLADGKAFKKDDMLFEFEGDIKDILKAERVILNLLQHMSGIATSAKEIIDIAKKANPSTLVVPTRKTTWGWLDKKAITLAGGGTHRLDLSHAILIKDNHLALFGNDIKKLLKAFKPPQSEYVFFELEIDDPEKVLEIAKELQKYQSKKLVPNPAVIMFDNMKPDVIIKLLDSLYQESMQDHFIFEASGGINKDTIADYVKTGVDVVSLGSLTQKITPIDLSLEIGG